ncbi:MAG: transcription-repair coupling factor [Deltaproteobacteria bacterium]|nr:MAG: transcription-repair coupling factor [Deltaproteobacteria bacterium]
MQHLISRLLAESKAVDIDGLNDACAALLLSRTAAALNKTICCIVAADDQLESLAQDIALFSDVPVLLYPSFEIPPYTPLSPDPATVASRLSTLYQLHEDSRQVIVLASAEAVLRKVMPAAVLDGHCELLIAGEEVDREQLVQTLVNGGYQYADMVRQEGDLAVRGGIVDIFPPSSTPAWSGPLRLDFFGDTVESIRLFDPLTQRSHGELTEVILVPVADALFPRDTAAWQLACAERLGRLDADDDHRQRLFALLREGIRYPGIEFHLPLLYAPEPMATFVDYLPGESLLAVLDPLACAQRIALVQERIAANYTEAVHGEYPALPPEELFLSQEEGGILLTERPRLRLCRLPDIDSPNVKMELSCGNHRLIAQEIELQRKKRGLLGPLVDRLNGWLGKGERVFFSCRSKKQMRHLDELFQGYQLRCEQAAVPLQLDQAGACIHLVEHPLSQGVDLPSEGLHLLSAAELFGEKRLRPSRRRKKIEPAEIVQLEALNHGDLVVHRDHGIGCFQGLRNLCFGEQRGDFVELAYRGDDKLFVPVDRLHLLSRYQGLTEQQPRLDNLGSTKWITTKQKVTDAVWKVAQELLDIYARREARQGHRFNERGPLFAELEESFPYDETPGQVSSIDAVLDDLTSSRPMDRLICGDVGFGKTEVAARAAFKVIEDGYQVAVLVPTTVLAEQHASTFRERFAAFPVEVDCLNRFRTPARQKAIIGQLGDGSLDMVVGTHRLLSKDVNFRRLGLLIVDEEHRFGVTHKEKIKKLKATVDVLTLTATPIPRTLQMSLLGIRDLSVISTPPRQRRAVKTFLARYDGLVIREAVLREMERQGQVFFIHNRVRTIARMAETVQQLVPHARVGVAHGQMPGAQLEEVMIRFINHELDVLVCTTIVESGLDIANANTIIINRADHLGLADIYQLRGRVGRSSRQSYAYLLVPSLEALTPDAQKRLRALMDCSELGAGFKLAMNDLQIRGGGNLLGVSQSGHIAAVGYDLYLELLQATVADLKKQAATGEVQADFPDPEITFNVSAFLPEDYVTDSSQRYHLYRRLSAAGLGTPEELADLSDELEDRFGPLPQEAKLLVRVIGLKHHLRPLGIVKLEQGPDSLIFTFADATPVTPEKLVELVQQHAIPKKGRPGMRLTPDQRLVVAPVAGDTLFEGVKNVVELLGR